MFLLKAKRLLFFSSPRLVYNLTFNNTLTPYPEQGYNPIVRFLFKDNRRWFLLFKDNLSETFCDFSCRILTKNNPGKPRFCDGPVVDALNHFFFQF